MNISEIQSKFGVSEIEAAIYLQRAQEIARRSVPADRTAEAVTLIVSNMARVRAVMLEEDQLTHEDLECLCSDWWNSLSPAAKKRYVDQHPRSKYSKAYLKEQARKAKAKAKKVKVNLAEAGPEVREPEAEEVPADTPAAHSEPETPEVPAPESADPEESEDENAVEDEPEDDADVLESALDDLPEDEEERVAELEAAGAAVTETKNVSPNTRGLIRNLFSAGSGLANAGYRSMRDKVAGAADAAQRMARDEATDEDRETVKSALAVGAGVIFGGLALAGLAFIAPNVLPMLAVAFLSNNGASQSSSDMDSDTDINQMLADFVAFVAQTDVEKLIEEQSDGAADD